ncbi:acyl-CoA synthetase [Mycobacterium sp. HM-7]
MSEWTLGAVLDAIADVVPDRLMTVCGDRRSTYAQVSDRTRRLSNFLAGRGFGVHRERESLQRWECGQDRVALIMHNDMYPDMLIGCLKARVVPVNVNHQYTPGEVRELLDYLKPRGVIYHRSLGAKFADILAVVGADLLISVDDGSTSPELPGAVTLNDALSQGDADAGIQSRADDVLMICTGGTTGRPKGVMWRQGDTYVVSMNGGDHTSVAEIHEKVRHCGRPWFAVSPLMHAAGLWTTLAAVLSGQTVVLYDNRAAFDARTVLEAAEREEVGLMTMVGDAYVGPLVGELRRRPYDLSSLSVVASGGAATNPKHQRALLELLPGITMVNGYGSSETGNVGFGRSRRDDPKDTFELRAGASVVSADLRRFLEPGDAEIGWVAREGRIPLGYFRDPDATRATFPEVDGRRVVISGDRGRLAADGTLELFGRDSLVVNTGGEKVFVEEVEEVLRAQPGVVDAVVVGRPSERWGEEVVALVAVQDHVEVTPQALQASCSERLAGFKIPKAFLFVEQVHRLGNGKADYRWARRVADGRVLT